MKRKPKDAVEYFGKTEDKNIRRLHELVAKAINEEKLMTTNLHHPPREVMSKGEKLSDKVAAFGGSWKFISYFMITLTVWIIYNALAIGKASFDPYPFILMNLILSCVAAIQAPIIMMSQNRKEDIDRKRAENDYMVNLKAEIEIRNLNEKLDLLMEEQLKTLMENQLAHQKLLNEINHRLSK
ncbi:MAG: DUF1003 domain-containing protein [Bacteroidota bacterium]|nr:DUF1003 domain-containing protein [Bacteroidota bacterium]